MASTLNTDESSVMFNLRELLRLQGEREAEEARAEEAQLLAARRAQEAEAEQLRRAQEAEAERAREAQERVQRAEVEREAALLRVQLEAAADERAHALHNEQAHAREIEHATARVASQWRRRTATLLTLCGLCAAGATWMIQRQLAFVSSTKLSLETTQRENAELRAALQQRVLAEPQASEAVTPQPPAAVEKPGRKPPAPHTKLRTKPHRTVHAATPEPELGEESSDPIEGL